MAVWKYSTFTIQETITLEGLRIITSMNKKIVIEILGNDAEQALAELLSNAQHDNLDCTIWIADKPDIALIDNSSLAYSPREDKEIMH